MTPQASRILRAFARGESIARIAESCGVSNGQAWSQLKRTVAEFDRKNPAVRWQQYLMLMRVVDQAFAAFDKSAEEGMSETASQTIENADYSGKLTLSGKSVRRRIRKDAGDVRFLEVALTALREIRDLFGLGAAAGSKLRAASPKGGLALEALVRTGAVRLVTRWAKPVEIGGGSFGILPHVEKHSSGGSNS